METNSCSPSDEAWKLQHVTIHSCMFVLSFKRTFPDSLPRTIAQANFRTWTLWTLRTQMRKKWSNLIIQETNSKLSMFLRLKILSPMYRETLEALGSAQKIIQTLFEYTITVSKTIKLSPNYSHLWENYASSTQKEIDQNKSYTIYSLFSILNHATIPRTPWIVSRNAVQDIPRLRRPRGEFIVEESLYRHSEMKRTTKWTKKKTKNEALREGNIDLSHSSNIEKERNLTVYRISIIIIDE